MQTEISSVFEDSLKHKIIVFDLDNTLLDFDAGEDAALKSLSIFAAGANFEELRKIYKESNNHCWKLYESGEITLHELAEMRFSKICDIVGDGSPREIGELFLKGMSNQIQLFSDAIPLIKMLKTNNKLAIATNGFAEVQRQRIEKSGLNEYFSAIHISEEVGFHKPSLEFFKVIASTHSCELNEILIIGDSIYSDVLGPTKHGVKSIHLSRNKACNHKERHICLTSTNQIAELLG